jgi:hypothetical protein
MFDCYVGLFYKGKELKCKGYKRAGLDWAFDREKWGFYNKNWIEFPTSQSKWGG